MSQQFIAKNDELEKSEWPLADYEKKQPGK
jgi:hypothetical protein